MKIIKRYQNGKFYNTLSCRYCSLNEIYFLMKEGYSVLDNRSKIDISQEVNLKIEYIHNLQKLKQNKKKSKYLKKTIISF